MEISETLLKSLINRILRRHSETRTNGMVPMTKQKRYREYLLSPSYSSNLYIAILFVLVSVKKKKEINICRNVNNSIAIFDRVK